MVRRDRITPAAPVKQQKETRIDGGRPVRGRDAGTIKPARVSSGSSLIPFHLRTRLGSAGSVSVLRFTRPIRFGS